MVVEGEVVGQPQEQLGQAGVTLEGDIVILDAAPESLDDTVVQCPSTSIPADGDPFAPAHARGAALGGQPQQGEGEMQRLTG